MTIEFPLKGTIRGYKAAVVPISRYAGSAAFRN